MTKNGNGEVQDKNGQKYVCEGALFIEFKERMVISIEMAIFERMCAFLFSSYLLYMSSFKSPFNRTKFAGGDTRKPTLEL